MRVTAAEIEPPAILVEGRFGFLLLLRADLAPPELVTTLDRLLNGREDAG